MRTEPIDLARADMCAELAQLMNACERSEPLFLRSVAPDELPGLLADPGAFQIEGQIWRGEGGAAEAFGLLRSFHVNGAINSDLRLFVDPALWHQHHEDAVLRWAIGRVQVVRADHGVPLTLYSDSRPGAAWRNAALERHGLLPLRASFVMERALQQPVADVALPEGYALDVVRAPDDLPAWVELFNAAYAGQWNYVPTTLDDQAELRRDERYQQRHDLIVRDADGALVGFCLGFVLLRGGVRAGWVLEIGALPVLRGRGLGRALLAEALRRFRQDGLEVARLVVDGANPTGARHLYEHMGFTVIDSDILYGRTLSDD